MSQHDIFLHNPTQEQVAKLFDFDLVESKVFAYCNGAPFQVPDFKAIVASDNNQVLGIHKSGYTPFQYKRLDQDASAIVNGDTVRKGAGLLFDRGVAFVQVGMPESIKSRSGVAFDPFLLGTTSANGQFKTIWKCGKIIVVCRNTHAAASQKGGIEIRVKHTANAEAKLTIENVQEALGILHSMGVGEAEFIDRLCDVNVSDSQFEAFLAKLIPSSQDAEKRTETIRSNKRDQLWTLFQTDARCKPDHTAWSVLQATNTFNHHYATQRGADDREVRNMEKFVNQDFTNDDAHSLRVLERVLNRELVAA